MFYLLLAVLSSTLISVIMRLSSGKVTASNTMLAANYLVCLILAGIYGNFQVLPVGVGGFGSVVAMGAVNGTLYLLGFVLLQVSVRKNGVVLSAVFMKLGLLVPIVLSLVVFREIPSAVQAAGFVLAVGAIVLINYEKNTASQGTGKWMLLLLLLAGGGGDAMAKIFAMFGPKPLEETFLFYTFLSALVLCLIMVLYKKERLQPIALLYGVLVGVPNFFSARFLLKAVSALPAVVVYPSFSVGTMLLVTVAGVLVFRERLRKNQWIALAVILAALILLNI
jgi:drug/metabolite transporter (DMT)-like permease